MADYSTKADLGFNVDVGDLNKAIEAVGKLQKAQEQLASASSKLSSDNGASEKQRAAALESLAGATSNVQKSYQGMASASSQMVNANKQGASAAKELAKSLDDVASAAGQATKSMDSGQWDQMAQSLRSTSSAALETMYATQQLSDMFSNIAGKGASAISEFEGAGISFQRNFADVERTLDDTFKDGAGNVDKLREQLVDLSTVNPISHETLTNIAGLGGQLGVAGEQIAEFSETIAKFAATTDVTAEKAAEQIGRIAQLGGSDGRFSQLASSIYETGVNAVATESAILNIAEELATVTKQAGLADYQLIALSSAMASVGNAPEMTRGTFTRFFGKIEQAIGSGGAKLQTFADLAGVTAEQFAAKWGDAYGGTQEMLTKLIDGMHRANVAGKSMSELVGNIGLGANVRDLHTLSKLIDNTDVYTKALQDTTTAYAENIALSEGFGIITDTTAAKLEMLGNTFQAIMAEMGHADWLSGFVEMLNKAAAAIYNLSKNPVAQWISALGIAVTGATVAFAAFLAVKYKIVTATAQLSVAEQQLGATNTSLGTSMSALVRQFLAVGRGMAQVSAAEESVAATSAKVNSSVQQESNTFAAATKSVQEYSASMREAASAKTAMASTTRTSNAGVASPYVSKALTGGSALSGAGATSNTGNYAATKLLLKDINIQFKETAAMSDLASNSMAKGAANASKFGSAAKVAAAGAATGMTTMLTATRLASVALSGLGTAMRTIAPMLALSAAVAAITAIGDAIAEANKTSRDFAQEAGLDFAGLAQAMQADLDTFKSTGEAVSVLVQTVSTAGEQAGVTASEWVSAADAQTVLADNVATTTDNLKVQTQALGEQSKAWIYNNIFGGEMGDTIAQSIKASKAELDAAGFSMDTLTQAMLQGGDAAKNYIDSLKTGYAGLLSVQNESSAAYVSGTNAMARAAAGAADSAVYAKEAEEAFKAISDAVEVWSGSQELAAEKTELLKSAANSLGLELDEEGNILTATGDKAVTFADQMQAAAGMISAAIDATMGAAQNTAAVEAAFENLGASLQKNGTEIGNYSEEARANLSALNQAVQALSTEAGGNMVSFTNGVIDMLMALAQQGVDTTGEMGGLYAMLNQIGSSAFNANFNTAAAQQDAANLKAQLIALLQAMAAAEKSAISVPTSAATSPYIKANPQSRPVQVAGMGRDALTYGAINLNDDQGRADQAHIANLANINAQIAAVENFTVKANAAGAAGSRAGNAIGRGFNNAAQGANKAAGGAGKAGKAAKGAGDAAKEAFDKAKQAIQDQIDAWKTLYDWVKEVNEVIDDYMSIKYDRQNARDAIAAGWRELRENVKQAGIDVDEVFNKKFGRGEALDAPRKMFRQLQEDAKEAKKDVTDLNQKIRDLNADLAVKQADAAKLKYQLNVAEKYGDVLRATQLRAELAKNASDQVGIRGDIASTKKEKATAQASNAPKNMSLKGSSLQAIENRETVRGLAAANAEYVKWLVEAGASNEKITKAAKEAKTSFETQATALGYSKKELGDYSSVFDLLIPKQTTATTAVVGNSKAAIENRAALQGQVEKYNSLLTAYANAGASQTQINNLIKSIKEQFTKQATQIGVNRTAIHDYLDDFNAFKLIYNKIPKDITVPLKTSLSMKPATQALTNWRNREKLKKLQQTVKLKYEKADTISAPKIAPSTVNAKAIVTGISNPYGYSVSAPVKATKIVAPRAALQGVSFSGNHRMGGAIYKAAGGVLGLHPGRPRGVDNVPIWAQAGEYVVRKSAVDRYGVPFMNALNSSKIEPARTRNAGPSVVAMPDTIVVTLSPADKMLLQEVGDRPVVISASSVTTAVNTTNKSTYQRGY